MRSETGTKITPGVIFENNSFLIIDKPTGWVTSEVKSTKAPVLETWLRKTFEYSISKSLELRSGIAHRLDKDTSGLLIVAKTENALKLLQGQFKERKIKKTYFALLHGETDENGIIDAPLGRLPWNKERFGVLSGGRPSITKYKLIQKYKREGDKAVYSFVEFYPESGRTHQIRVHAKHIGHPVISDNFYAGRKTSRRDLEWCPRLFLHAAKISFFDPVSGEELAFKSKLPKDLKLVLSNLVELE